MLVAPATGPSIMPARITSIGCRVIGTGVNGSGIAICDAAATAAAKPTTPTTKSRLSFVSIRAARVCMGLNASSRNQLTRDTLSATASPPPR